MQCFLFSQRKETAMCFPLSHSMQIEVDTHYKKVLFQNGILESLLIECMLSSDGFIPKADLMKLKYYAFMLGKKTMLF